MKTLIVEDVHDCLTTLETAFRISVFREPTPITLSNDPANKLRDLGLDVAETYKEAEQLVESNSYDYVLLDHNLPYETGQDPEDKGYELIPKIRQRNPATIIIGTSSNLDVRDQAGLDHVLGKSDIDFMERLRDIYGD